MNLPTEKLSSLGRHKMFKCWKCSSSDPELIGFIIFIAVADTFWSVYIKCCFHQKKIKSKRPTTRIRPAERQHKGRAQKTWQAKHRFYTALPSNTKFQTDQSGIQRQTVYRLNQIKFDFKKAKSKERRKEANKSWRRPKKMMLWKSTENFPLMM